MSSCSFCLAYKFWGAILVRSKRCPHPLEFSTNNVSIHCEKTSLGLKFDVVKKRYFIVIGRIFTWTTLWQRLTCLPSHMACRAPLTVLLWLSCCRILKCLSSYPNQESRSTCLIRSCRVPMHQLVSGEHSWVHPFCSSESRTKKTGC